MMRRILVPALCAAVLATGCSYDATKVPEPTKPRAADGAAPPSCDNDASVRRSYAPAGVTAAEAKDDLIADGRLTVGVSADSYLLGYADPFENNRLVGFDIDLANRIADELGVKIDFKVITAADRIPMLLDEDQKTDGELAAYPDDRQIDLVVRNFTISCDRWERIAFSSVYYQAGQKVLVRKDLAKDYSGPEDLEGRTVCVPAGTSSLTNIEKASPDAEIETAANHTGCLVKFQQGQVEAITGDDTVLAGLSAQDPYAEVPTDQDAFSEEPYGVGANPEATDLVRFVNKVIEDGRSDGSWQRSYAKWLQPYLGKGSAPAPAYGR